MKYIENKVMNQKENGEGMICRIIAIMLNINLNLFHVENGKIVKFYF